MLFAIFALLAVGASWCLVGVIFGDAPKRGIPVSLIQFGGSVISVLAGLTIAACMGERFTGGDKMYWTLLAIYAISGTFNYFGQQAMAAGMKRGPNGAVWGIMQSALIFPFIMGILFFAQPLTYPSFAGIIFLAVALVFFSLAKNSGSQPENMGKSWRFYALMSLTMIAIQQSLFTIPSYMEEGRNISAIVRALATASGAFFGVFLTFFYEACRNFKEWVKMFACLKRPRFYLYTMGLQFFSLIFAYTLLYPGVDIMAELGAGSVSYPLMVGSCIVSFSLYSIWQLKEKATRIQILALVFCVIGLVGLCIPKDIWLIPFKGQDLVPYIQALVEKM